MEVHPEPARLPRRAVAVVVGCLCVLAIGCVFLPWVGTFAWVDAPARSVTAAIIVTVLGLLAMALPLGLPSPIRPLFGWLGASITVLGAATAISSLGSDVIGDVTRTYVAVPLIVVAAGLGATGLLRAPTDPEPRAISRRTALDVTIVVLVAGYFAWIVALGQISRPVDTLWRAAAAVAGSIAAALLVGTAVVTVDRVEPRWSRPVWLAAIGASLVGAGGIIGAWDVANATPTGIRTPTGAIMAGAVLILAARFLAPLSRPTDDGERSPILPVLAPAGAAMALIIGTVRQADGSEIAGFAFWGVVVIMIASLIRQAITITENDRLNETLRSSLAALRHQATHDDLTGLLNRQKIRDRLDRLRRRADRDGGIGVLIFDIDRFVEINDSLGRDRGDTLLVEIACRLRTAIGESGDVARYGGDSFLVTAAAADTAEVEAMAERLRAMIAAPTAVGGVEVIVTASVGAVFEPAGRPDPIGVDDLLRDADFALRNAKSTGRDRVAMFTTALLSKEGYRLALAADLRTSLRNDEIEPFYQPLVNLRTGEICGAEALIRWNHPLEGVILPDRWLDVAETTGMLVEIGRATMAESCRRFGAINAHRPLSPVRVAINLSAVEIRASGLVEQVAHILATSGLSPQHLIFEVSEQIVGDAQTVEVLGQLHQLGVRLSIDDFGTGFSGLGQLRRFPVDEIKIDQSFIAGLGVDPSDTAIVRAICDLGTGLGLDIVAEGVTTEAQVEQLLALGCDSAQGWLYGRAQPFSRFAGLLGRIDHERRTTDPAPTTNPAPTPGLSR